MIRAVYRPRRDDILLIAPDGSAVLPVPLSEADELGAALIAAAATSAHATHLIHPPVNPTGDTI